MRFLTGILIAAAVAVGGNALAGEAFNEKVKCPIGGKQTKIVSTFGCSVWGTDFAMSLRRPSSCDFVTRLPVCDREDFPIYREFDKDEVGRLKDLVKTEEYQASKQRSRYFRAYIIEKEFGKFSPEELFWLLQSGFFYDPNLTYGDEEYFRVYSEAANAFYQEAEDDDKHFILLASAFARVHTDNPKKALIMLGREAKLKREEQTIWGAYSRLVSACVGKPDAPECAPEHIVDLAPKQ